MKNEFWQKVEEVFHAALEHEPAKRSEFLDEACRGDVDLRQRVEELLRKDTEAKNTVESALPQQKTTATAAGLTGSQLGQYRIVSFLGAGGMGEVYRAHDSKLGRDVAIKLLPDEFARDPDRLARFRREARTLASINHPNIAAIYGLEESGTTECLVLELVEGETPRGPLQVADALRIAKQVAEALEAAHRKGVIHRDLKPSNVKVTPEGRVKVLDFGLAKAVLGPDAVHPPSQMITAVSDATMAGKIVGTPAYMSPEQARGKEVDQRADIWAFGCLLYELLAGKRPFDGETQSETIAAVLEREPDWRLLPADVPDRIRELLRRCLQKDVNRRPATIDEARRTIEELHQRSNWKIAVIAAAALALFTAAVLWLRSPVRPADSSQWVQLTKFSDSVTSPALSPDGRMVTFIRGPSTFFGPGQVFVKILPDGEPVQLTHDDIIKMSPVFSPDGTRIAYTTYLANGFAWDTWVVPVLGGEPQQWLKNASGLIWTSPKQLLFSEIKMGTHMGVVAADENRIGQHDVYLPMAEPSMAHRSYLSPDGKWVLLVEMDEDHLWEPCRLVPANGSSTGRKVGPSGGGCTVAAWSSDGKWMFFTSNAVGANHIWRQRFPDGKPEQVTSGPTEEEGIAMAPDGRSFITAVALQSTTLWIHDGLGERQISLEGNVAESRFTRDGKKLLYRVVKEGTAEQGFYRDTGEVRIADSVSGRSEAVAPGFQALGYDVSADGRQVVMQIADSNGKSQLWVAPLDHSAPPRQIPNAEGGSPRFLPDGEILFRRIEGSPTMAGTTGFMYRVRPDGSGLKKALDQPIHIVLNVSPDGKWLIAWAPLPDNGPIAFQAFPLHGGPAINIGSSVLLQWTLDNKSVFVLSVGGVTMPQGRAYVVPLTGEKLPPIPSAGLQSEDDISRIPGARRMDLAADVRSVTGNIALGPSADVYAFYRGSVQRNLYRIPIP